MKYRKKPVVVEAFRWSVEKDRDDLPDWLVKIIMYGDAWVEVTSYPNSKLMIRTLEGVMEASIGDYIIQGIKGEIYPCKPDIFEQTYEVVE